MALTPSTMLDLGTLVPDFALRDTVSGRSMGCNIKWKPGNGPDYFG
jgi:hypothetical protein